MTQQGNQVDDQTECVLEAPPKRATDRTYVARLGFLTAMHLLRLDVADAAVLVDSFKEDHIRIGSVTVPVLEQVTEGLSLLLAARRASEQADARNAAGQSESEDG